MRIPVNKLPWMMAVDDAWLLRFAMCVQRDKRVLTKEVVDFCKMASGVPDGFKSGKSTVGTDGGEPTADNGEDGGRPGAQHITPAEDLELKTVPTYLKVLDATARGMDPYQDAHDSDRLGEWYVEPAAPLTGRDVWLGSGKKKRKQAEAQAQWFADETGTPWRIVRWYGEVGPTLADPSIKPFDDIYYVQTERDTRAFITWKRAKRHLKRESQNGRSRCRITRTFFPRDGGRTGGTDTESTTWTTVNPQRYRAVN